MVIHLRLKCLYRVTMATKFELNSVVAKSKLFNRIDEAFGMISISISRELLFHVDIMKTFNKLWLKLETLFRRTDEMRVHKLENELISMCSAHFVTIQYFFIDFKSLVLQLK